MSSDITVKEGKKFALICNATGRPQPTLVWRRQGNAILPGGGVVKLVRHAGHVNPAGHSWELREANPACMVDRRGQKSGTYSAIIFKLM